MRRLNRINMNNKDIAIKVENISKLYRIGLKEAIRDSFASTIFSFIKSPFTNYRKYRSLYKFDDVSPNTDIDESSKSSDVIWALKDVSFEVKQGEVLGIIGRNGSGKSTLLKILSRITHPTTGCIKIRGSVTTLLEVGTGFHPELSGRENVYLNSTILGMTKKEVDSKFDEIVEFSGVEKFIDTPVKRYSSGMKVRLAFSVAAHLEADIMLIDEVLAVGDAEFQKKCLNKMKDVSLRGRTVLLVSHNMAAISGLCTSAILLDKGSLTYRADTNSVVKEYMDSLTSRSAQSINERTDRAGDDSVRVLDLWLENSRGQRIDTIACNDNLSIKISYQADKIYKYLNFRLSINNDLEERILNFDTRSNPIDKNSYLKAGTVSCTLTSPISLCPGRYSINVAIFNYRKMADYVPAAIIFNVIGGDFFGTGKLPDNGLWPMVLMPHKWRLE